jgi:hypothetical protein
MTGSRPPSTIRLAAFAALLAMCLRLLLPLLHGGHDCHHHHALTACGVEVAICSCGVVHTDAGDVEPGDLDPGDLDPGALDPGNLDPNGEHQPDDGEPCTTCLACQLEDQSPGGAPLAVVVVPAGPLAAAPVRTICIEADVVATCVRPPPRAPPYRTV